MSDVTNPAARLRLALGAAASIAVWIAVPVASAQRAGRPDSAPPNDLALSQYLHDRWTTADGLPNHSIDWIARSPDGYLWLGTEGGLVRFDGIRFTAFNRNTTSALEGTDFYPTIPLLVDRKGVLWISTSNGLVQYANGELRRTATPQGQPPISRMVEDHSGNFWAWEQDIDGQLYEMRNGRLVQPAAGSGLPAHVGAVAADSSGDIWIATLDRGLLRVRDGRAISVWKGGALAGGVNTLFVSRDGTLWVGTQQGFGRLADGHLKFHKLGGGGLAGYVSAFAQDSAGDVWLGTVGMGVLRWHGGRLERFGQSDGLSRDQVTSLLIDDEGSIWVGTRGGLDRLRRGAIATFTPHNGGPPFTNPGALLWDRNSRFVVGGATAGLAAGRPDAWVLLPGATSQKVWTLAHGREGIWVGGDSSLTLYRDYIVRRTYRLRDRLSGKWVLAIAEDSLARLWVATDQGLFRLSGGSVRAFTLKDGLPHSYVRALLVDRHGAVWAGTNAGLAQVEGDSIHSWRPADGLSGPLVFTIRETHDGSIWVGTSGGLTRLRDGRLAAFRAEHGLPGEMVTAIEEAGSDLWIATGSGISRISLEELNAVADGRAQRVHGSSFGSVDGLSASEGVAGAQPLSAQTPDGRLWFSTAAGLAVIDPRHLPRNAIAPAVHIEEVSADGTRLTRQSAARGIAAPPRTRRLTLSYTATSLLLPDRVRFRYRLVGYDSGWTEVPSSERAVSYTNLPPGRYTFRVIAANDAGVWNFDGASLEFAVLPAFYQAVWFRALSVAAFVALLVGIHRARVRQFERRAEERKRADDALAKLRSELAQATRLTSLATLTASIAHEVNQPLAGIVMNASTCLRMLSREPPNVGGASDVARRLIRDSQRASDVITRLRALFSRKAPVAEPVDLNDAAREVIALSRSELHRAQAIVHTHLAEDLPFVMGDRVQLQQVIINLLRNACEAVHGIDDRPREIAIETATDADDRVRLSIGDSGVGFEPEGGEKLFDAFYTTKPDGMGIGLSVSRTIIENHGGRLWLVSNDGPGVTVSFSIPRAPALDARHPVTYTASTG